MELDQFINTMNDWGKQQVPFLFIIDFEMQNPVLQRLADIRPEHILYHCNGLTNSDESLRHRQSTVRLAKFPIPMEAYEEKFRTVLHHLEYGDSYLANLTIKTRLDINLALQDLFFISKAKYKLLYQDSFLVFSPEIFVQIRDGKIFSYPMKGTIDSATPFAREKILNDAKELAEHVTIVDLIRNDLSEIATNVRVARFRYIDEIRTHDKKLLQVSSEIVGDLAPGYASRMGHIIATLLPAGSVTGAPKHKTVEIIRSAEKEKRGYYTGVFGVFDGRRLDSGVMIRFIERIDNTYYYRSGGGITTQSVLEKEYQEAIDKVYVPVN